MSPARHFLRWFGALVALFTLPLVAPAWDRDEAPLWPDGTVRLEINLDGPLTSLSDGRTYDQVVQLAATTWNNYVKRVQFTTVLNSSAPVDNYAENGRNNLTFGTTIGGEPLGSGILAVTLIDFDDTQRRETDVVFNSRINWNSYRGQHPDYRPPTDLLRVALHELGHVLGLDHPDEVGQWQAAIMRSYVGDTDSLTEDDKDGAAELYGAGPGYAPQPPTFHSHPYSSTVEEGTELTLSAGYHRATTFQWFKNGVAVAAATSAQLRFNPVRLTDAGSYTLRITNVGGSVTSNAAVITVTAARPPSLGTLWPQSATVGESVSFYISSSGSYPMTFQWFRDGVALPNTNSSSLSLTASRDTAGLYHAVATNIAGTATSNAVVFAVRPLLPAVVGTQGSVRQVYVGESFSFEAGWWWSGTYTFAWYKDGVLISGATSSSYSRSAAQLSDAGDYYAVVSNAAGSSVTGTTRVVVNPRVDNSSIAWKDSRRVGDVYYFLFEFPARVERYDLAQRTWLDTIPITGGAPAAFLPESDGVLVAVGSSLRRYPLTGGESQPVASLPATPTYLTRLHGYLVSVVYGYYETTFTSIDPATGQTAGTTRTIYGMQTGYDVAPAGGWIFGWSTGTSPADIGRLGLNADGTFTTAIESPYHGDYPGATRTFVLPDELGVADNSGTVYRTSDLRFRGSLGGGLIDLSATSDGRILVLRGNQVDTYDTALDHVSSQTLGVLGVRLAVRGDAFATFASEATGRRVSVAWHDRAQPGRRPVADIVSAEGRTVPAQHFFVDQAGVLHILSKLHRNLFRWSTTEQRFLPSIPLQGAPDHLAYSAENDCAYLGYADGTVTSYDAADAALEQRFARAPVQILGLTTAGENVMLVDPSGAWSAYYLYDAAGQLLDRTEWVDPSRQYAWDAGTRRLFHFRDNSSPNDLEYQVINADGTFGDDGDSPYHGEVVTTSPLIRVASGGGAVLLGSGRFYSTTSLQQVAQLPVAIDDAAWLGPKLYTLRATLDGVEIAEWAALDLSLVRTATVPGIPKRIFALSGNRLLVVSSVNDYLTFHLFDDQLAPLGQSSTGAASRLINLSARAWVGTDDQQVIPGFVLSGSGPKPVVVRAVGPSLQPAGVNGFLADPRLILYNQAAASLADNDDWTGLPNLAAFLERGAAVGANPFLTGSRDSGLLAELMPGAYSAHTSGTNRTSGVSVIEVYDGAPADGTSRLVNLSARARVGGGEDVLIAGFVISGQLPLRLLIHGLGPKLAGVLSDTLVNPSLTLYNQNSTALQSNDDWQDTPALRAAWARVGSGELGAGSKDAALLVDLPPGLYSVILRGDSAVTGIGMIELYEVP